MKGKKKPQGNLDEFPRIKGISAKRLAQLRKESRENIRIMRKACGLDPDEVPKGPVSIAGILADFVGPEEDSVELVNSVRYDY